MSNTAVPSKLSDPAGRHGDPWKELVNAPKKLAVLRREKGPQILKRLSALGFKAVSNDRYVNSQPTGNVREITFFRDPIEFTKIWLVVLGRKPFVYTTALYKATKEDLERALILARNYWLKTIQGYVENRMLRGAEWYIARDAFDRMRRAAADGLEWNKTIAGKECPIPAEEFPEWKDPRCRPPEPLYADKALRPELLATIAAPLTTTTEEKLVAVDAIPLAHELLVAAKHYIASLPKAPEDHSANAIDHFDLAFSTVTFKQIQETNKQGSRVLPLLPALQQRRKGIEPERISGAQQIKAIRQAVKAFLRGSDATYVHDCLENGHIRVCDLCAMRWNRFTGFWQKQGKIALGKGKSSSKRKTATRSKR